MNKILFLTASTLAFLTFMNSCSKNETNINNCQERSNIYSLERKNNVSIIFKLDSLTSPNLDYIKLVTINDTLFFTLLNSFTNTIYCYEYKSKKIYKTIPLTSKKKLTGYEIINWNKILTYQYWSNNLTLQDNTGSILKSIVVPSHGGSYYSLPTSHAPIIYKDKSIYLAGGMMSRSKPSKIAPIVAQIDSSLSKISYLYHYPDIYTKLYFGGSHYHMDLTYTYNPHQDFFVFNFPASHKLFVTKDFVNELEYCAGSEFIESIPEYRNNEDDNALKFCTENGFYFAILYDQYNDCYYRICLLPSKWNELNPFDRDLSVIILDKDFNVVGEKRLKNNFDFYFKGISCICVSPDGLLFRQANDSYDESSVSFVSYKLVKR